MRFASIYTRQQNATAAWAAPRTLLGELTALPMPPRWFCVFAAGRDRRKRGERKGGKGREKKDRGRKGEKKREGRLTLMRSCNRAADWLRPNLA